MKFKHLPGDKTSKGGGSNVSQPASGLQSAGKNPLVCAQSADKQIVRSGTGPSPKGKGGSHSGHDHTGHLRWPGMLVAPLQQDVCLPQGASGGPWHGR